MKLSQVPWPFPAVSLVWNAESVPTLGVPLCGCGCLIKWLKKPCRVDFSLLKPRTSMGDRKECLWGWWGVPRQVLHGCSFLPYVPPTCPFHNCLNTCFLWCESFLLPRHCFVNLWQSISPVWVCQMSACLCNSYIPFSLTLASPSSPSLPFLLTPHLSGKMNQNRSEHLLWTNKCSICSCRSPLSMATHEGELQDVFQAD